MDDCEFETADKLFGAHSFIDVNVSNKILASCAGAFLTSIIVTPFDVVKTRLQAQEKIFFQKKCFLYYNGLWDHICYCGEKVAPSSFKNNSLKCIWYKRPGHFEGTLDAFIKIVKNEGISSLWSGLPPTLVMALPATVLYFTTYDVFREYICNSLHQSSPPFWVPCIAGAIARTLTVSAISPLEFIRTKMQSESLTYSDLLLAVSKLIKKKGFLSLWHGYSTTILRDVPFSVIYWSLYEKAKQSSSVPEPSIFFSFIAGAAAGTIAAFLTFPFDVVKTHRQIELGEQYLLQNKKMGTKEIMYDLYKKKGIKALYAGLSPRLIKVAPACAIMIASFEYGKKYLSENK